MATNLLSRANSTMELCAWRSEVTPTPGHISDNQLWQSTIKQEHIKQEINIKSEVKEELQSETSYSSSLYSRSSFYNSPLKEESESESESESVGGQVQSTYFEPEESSNESKTFSVEKTFSVSAIREIFSTDSTIIEEEFR